MSSGVARSPRAACAGPPGRARSQAKSRTDRPSRIGTSCRSRRTMKRSTACGSSFPRSGAGSGTVPAGGPGAGGRVRLLVGPGQRLEDLRRAERTELRRRLVVRRLGEEGADEVVGVVVVTGPPEEVDVGLTGLHGV